MCHIFVTTVLKGLNGSDHLMIYGERVEKGTVPPKVSEIRSFKKFNKEKLLLDLVDAPCHLMEIFSSVDAKWSYWRILFVKVRMKKDSLEWIDEDIHKLMRTRNYFRKKYQKCRAQEDWEAFKNLCKEVNHMMRQAKVGFFTRV